MNEENNVKHEDNQKTTINPFALDDPQSSIFVDIVTEMNIRMKARLIAGEDFNKTVSVAINEVVRRVNSGEFNTLIENIPKMKNN